MNLNIIDSKEIGTDSDGISKDKQKGVNKYVYVTFIVQIIIRMCLLVDVR